MRKTLGPAIMAGLLALTLASASRAETGYETYYDVLDDAPWYDGVRASIQHQPTPVEGEDLAVWIGIDNGEDPQSWIQGGWGQQHEGQPLIYWEYVGADGEHHLGEDAAPGDNEAYAQQHVGSRVEWTHDDTVYKQVDWQVFDGVTFRKGEYGAEMQPKEDSTPGRPLHKNRFSSTQVRRTGGDFASAPLAVEVSTATNGNIEKIEAEPGSDFQTWDSR
jgi:hypothetical protein